MIQIKSALKKSFGAEGFNHAWNEHFVAGQSVPHFHLHVLPRTNEDEVKYGYEPRQFLYRSESKRDLLLERELKKVAELIKGSLDDPT
jgi:histidine triad (HIT) family protein